MYNNFDADISRMNETYDLAPIPRTYEGAMKRLGQFQEILDKEFTELLDIQVNLDTAAENIHEDDAVMEARVGMADLLMDIIVYCASEAQRWGLPLDVIGYIVMASNFSKLGADGKPIKNPVTDKFEKGPNYWKPEPYIHALLQKRVLTLARDEMGLPCIAKTEGMLEEFVVKLTDRAGTAQESVAVINKEEIVRAAHAIANADHAEQVAKASTDLQPEKHQSGNPQG